MKKVKFVNKDKSDFYPVLKEQVDHYFKSNNLNRTGGSKLITKAVVVISFYVIPFVLILTGAFSPIGMLLLAFIMGIGVSGVGMSVMHDANHGSFSNNAKLNQFFGWTMYLLGGNVYNWKLQHNTLHHTYTNIHELDEDITGKFLLRLSLADKKKKIQRYQHIYAFLLYGLMTFSFLAKDFKQIFRFKRSDDLSVKSYPRKELIILISTKILYFFFILALPLLLTDITIGQWFLGFFVMHFTAGLIMSIVFQLAHIVEGVSDPVIEPNGDIENSWAIHQMKTTANFSGNKLLSWFVGGLDYQIEHHLFPNISHVHYKSISQIVKNTARDYNIPYNDKSSFSNAIGSHINMLKTLGR